MRRVSNDVSHAFARKLKATGVTVAEWVVLRQLYGLDEPAAPSTVATGVGLSRGAISKLIERLLEKGLLTRRASGHDRRYQEVELTPSGRVLVPRLIRLADDNDVEFFRVLTKSERSTLSLLLEKLAEMHGLTTTPID